jgi:ribonucleotide reductase alpha subunit
MKDIRYRKFGGKNVAKWTWIQPISEEVFGTKYKFHRKSVEEVFEDISTVISGPENPDIKKDIRQKFYDEMIEGRFIPAGRILANAWPKSGIKNLMNCYTIGIDDSMESIYDSLKEDARISKVGGGVGFDISNLRPKNSPLSVGGEASGPISFLRIFDASAKTIMTGGSRRAAHIALLDVSHPDIEEFITCKQGDKNRVLTQFNISVKITNKFMNAVEKDLDWDLTFNGKVYKTVKARYLYDLIAHNGFENNEPGMFNTDIINKYNNGWYGYTINECNPCIVGDTLIAVADGRNAVSIKDLAEIGEDVPVYTKDEKGKTVIRMMRNPRITGYDAKIVKVHLDDGTFVRCTENHNFMLNDGTYKEAKDLVAGDSLKRFDSYVSNNNYRQIVSGTARDRRQYRMIAEFNGLITDGKTQAVHHYDFDSLNDLKENLVVMDRQEHHRMHSERMRGANNPVNRFPEKNPFNNPEIQQKIREEHHIGAKRSEETRRRIGEKTRERCQDPVYMKKFHAALAARNHKVLFIEEDGIENVYNGTVDEFHNYAIVTSHSDDRFIESSGIFIKNCGEQMLPRYGICNLGAINLTKFVKNEFEDGAEFNFLAFAETVKLGVRFLDNVLDVSEYPLEKVGRHAHDWRRIGLGFTGLGNVFAMMKIKYGSEESKKLSKEIAKSLRDNSYLASAELAKEKGKFPNCDKEKLLESNFVKRLPEEIKVMISKHGLRNVCINTVAPTGTISLTVGQNCSSGIEPIFALEYKRRVRKVDDEFTEQIVYDYAWLQYQAWCAKKGLLFDPNKIPEYFVTTKDINAYDSIDIQAIFQKYVDASISKTLNLPENITFEEYKNLFKYAYEKELKGFTTFNPLGSMKGILEYNDPKAAGTNGNGNGNGDGHYIKRRMAPTRPNSLECDIHQFMVKDKKNVVLVGKLNGSLYEVFVDDDANGSIDGAKYTTGVIRKTGKGQYSLVVQEAGKDKTLVENLSKNFGGTYGSLARLVSMSLRHGTPLQFIVDQLSKSREFAGFEKSVSRVLKKYIKDGEVVMTSTTCPICGSNLVFKEGCVSCPECFWSKCA